VANIHRLKKIGKIRTLLAFLKRIFHVVKQDHNNEFHGNILSLSENITNILEGCSFLTHTVDVIGSKIYSFMYNT